jgi:hypothetical protein
MLQHMHEFVRDKLTSARRVWCEGAVAEDNVGPHRERRRPDVARCRRGLRIGMHAHGTETVPESGLHETTRGGIERPSGTAQNILHGIRQVAFSAGGPIPGELVHVRRRCFVTQRNLAEIMRRTSGCGEIRARFAIFSISLK